MALFEDTFPPYVPFGSRLLTLQSPSLRGSDVAVLQALYDVMLRVMNPGPSGSPIPITGIYDATTAQAVRNVEAYFGLAVDGQAGSKVYFVFGQGVGPNTTYGGPVYGSRQLTQGMSGGDVTVLQNRLNTFAPYARLVGGPASGVFNASTASAVLAFKQTSTANGNTGLAANAVVGFGTYDATWLYTFAGGRGLLVGSQRNGLDVAFVQTVLHNLGLYTGSINGLYDTATVAAVQAFQRAQAITADGNVGPVTFYRLGLQNQNTAPGPFPIAFPPSTPPVSVTTCSVGLVTGSTDLHPYGEATIAVNELEGFESLDVVGNNLPEPSSFGSDFSAYAFTLTNPSTGQVVASQLMTPLPGDTDDWGGSVSVGVATIPKGVVTVYPTVENSATGPYGPAVIGGNLANCT